MDVLVRHSCDVSEWAISHHSLANTTFLHYSMPPSKRTCKLTTCNQLNLHYYTINCFSGSGLAKEEVAAVAVAAAREASERGVKHRRDWIEVDELGFRRCEGQRRGTRSDSWVPASND